MGRVIFCKFVLILFAFNFAYAGTIKGKVSSKKLKSPQGVLIYIEKVQAEFPPPSEPAKMDQKNLVFIPRVLPILKGTKVEFHNSDDLKHNVFGIGDNYDFDLGTWTRGMVRSYTFNELGEVAILCNVHPEMEAYIVVLQNPYFALSDEEGNYQIENVPAGTYTLKTWHDRLKSKKVKVSVPEKGVVELNFELR